MAAPAALQPPGGGLPPQPTRSFIDALATPTQPQIAPSSQTTSSSPLPNPVHTLATHGTHKGLPSIAFSDSENADLSKPFIWTLIGKFSQGYNKRDPKLGRPSVDELQKYFVALDFKGSFQLGLLDNRHLLIQFQREEDYIRMFSRMVWYIRRVTKRILKWSPFFHVDKESSVVPIWISLPHLPVHLFQKAPLFSIARLFGHPLRLDDATTTLKRPSVARVQVEIDVLKELPDKFWIQLGTQEGFWQQVDFENVPSYCSHCWKIGHAQEFCHVQHPALRPVSTRTHQLAPNPVTQPRQHQVFVPKDTHTATTDAQQTEPTVVSIQELVVPDKANQPIISPEVPLNVAATSGIPPDPNIQIPMTVNSQHETVSLQPVSSLPQQQQPQGLPTTALISVTPYPKVRPVRNPPLTTHAVLAPDAPPPTTVPATANLVNSMTPNASELVTQELVILESEPTLDVSNGPSPQSMIVQSSKVSNMDEIIEDALISVQPTTQDAPQQNSLIGKAPDTASPSIPMIQSPNQGRQLDKMGKSVLSPYAEAFPSPTPSEAYSTHHRTSPTRWPLIPLSIEAASTEGEMGFHDSDYHRTSGESDNLEDDGEDIFGITDGSEDRVCRKRQGRRKSKALTTIHSASKEDFEEQSRILGSRIKKRGRPQGSRNRTFFDVVRTMTTRNTRSTSS